MSTPIYDEGLQPERTELAWRRTALSFGVASLVGFRVISDAIGNPSWSIATLFAIVVAGAIWLGARRRHLQTNGALSTGRAEDLPSGALPLVVASLTAAVAVGGLVATLVLLTR